MLFNLVTFGLLLTTYIIIFFIGMIFGKGENKGEIIIPELPKIPSVKAIKKKRENEKKRRIEMQILHNMQRLFLHTFLLPTTNMPNQHHPKTQRRRKDTP